MIFFLQVALAIAGGIIIGGAICGGVLLWMIEQDERSKTERNKLPQQFARAVSEVAQERHAIRRFFFMNPWKLYSREVQEYVGMVRQEESPESAETL